MVLKSTKLVEHGATCPVVVHVKIPKPIAPGSATYYKDRNDDFLDRHPGPVPAPPRYYMAFGNKYANRFRGLKAHLSPRGQEWVEKTFFLLQDKIERRRAACPSHFDELERSPKEFEDFAIDTHSDAYLEAGVGFLPAGDIRKILLTLDRDAFTWGGMVEIAEVIPGAVKQSAEGGIINEFGNMVREEVNAIILRWRSGKQCVIECGTDQ
ncbi:MAG: hypothetical protein HUU55_23740 [Myxococcales bacterium]|nr:hypothetical protein [Myxococcales bacterium]